MIFLTVYLQIALQTLSTMSVWLYSEYKYSYITTNAKLLTKHIGTNDYIFMHTMQPDAITVQLSKTDGVECNKK